MRSPPPGWRSIRPSEAVIARRSPKSDGSLDPNGLRATWDKVASRSDTAPDIQFGEWIPADVRLNGAICLCCVPRLELERIESDSATEGPARPISIGRSDRIHVHR
jgi:hypothetical protein